MGTKFNWGRALQSAGGSLQDYAMRQMEEKRQDAEYEKRRKDSLHAMMLRSQLGNKMTPYQEEMLGIYRDREARLGEPPVMTPYQEAMLGISQQREDRLGQPPVMTPYQEEMLELAKRRAAAPPKPADPWKTAPVSREDYIKKLELGREWRGTNYGPYQVEPFDFSTWGDDKFTWDKFADGKLINERSWIKGDQETLLANAAVVLSKMIATAPNAGIGYVAVKKALSELGMTPAQINEALPALNELGPDMWAEMAASAVPPQTQENQDIYDFAEKRGKRVADIRYVDGKREFRLEGSDEYLQGE